MAVSAPSRAQRYSVDDLDRFPDDGKLRELVDGQVVEWDVTTLQHGFFLTALSRLLANQVWDLDLGLVVGGDPLVRVLGSEFDARGPDIAFYARHRVPRDLTPSSTGVAPDFVIEVLSPSDRAAQVQQKIHDWLRAGVRLLWYVNPETGLTAIYHAGTVAYVPKEERLDGADVIPGFSLRLQEVFDKLAALQGSQE